MSLVDENHANTRRFKLRSGGVLTLSCTNLFPMAERDRNFVLNLLGQIEDYEALDETREAEEAERS